MYCFYCRAIYVAFCWIKFKSNGLWGVYTIFIRWNINKKHQCVQCKYTGWCEEEYFFPPLIWITEVSMNTPLILHWNAMSQWYLASMMSPIASCRNLELEKWPLDGTTAANMQITTAHSVFLEPMRPCSTSQFYTGPSEIQRNINLGPKNMQEEYHQYFVRFLIQMKSWLDGIKFSMVLWWICEFATIIWYHCKKHVP